MSQVQVSQIRQRDVALELLLPKILGILWATGYGDQLGAKATVDGSFEIGATHFRPGGIALSVWSPTTKMFSVQLADDPHSVDPQYFRYQSGHCCVLSWHRGTWEDRMMACTVQPREIAQSFKSGLVPTS